MHQLYDYFYILDFEATCLKDMRISPQEIIEFPCLKINGQTMEIEDQFHKYVKPVVKPKLSPFCIKLTKIKQKDVNGAETFTIVFHNFKQWLDSHNISNHKVCFVTCGDWDLKIMLPAQCQLSELKIPNVMKSWINFKKVFETVSQTKIKRDENDLQQMMRHFNIEHEGILHSGIDDVKNMAKLLAALAKETVLKPTTEEEMTSDEPELMEIDTIKVDLSSMKKISDPLKQKFDYFICLDFEATCLKDMRISPQEIIEFPALKVNARTGAVESMFHSYVKPERKPKLSPFCIKLTKITQKMVDDKPNFTKVYSDFQQWMKNENILGTNFILVTCGDWDLKTMLPNQCMLSGLEIPKYLKKWINVKKVFEEKTNTKLAKERNDMLQLLEALGIKHEGTLHSGIDDTKNLAKIIFTLSMHFELDATMEVN